MKLTKKKRPKPPKRDPSCETAERGGKGLDSVFQVCVTSRLPQVDLIAELKKRQVSPQVREGKDGAIEDIITGKRHLVSLA